MCILMRMHHHTHKHTYIDTGTLHVYKYSHVYTNTLTNVYNTHNDTKYIYSHVCTNTQANIHIQTWVHYTYTHTHTYTPTHSQIYTIHTQIPNVYTHTYAPTHTRKYTYKHGYTVRIQILTRIHQHTHEYMHIWCIHRYWMYLLTPNSWLYIRPRMEKSLSSWAQTGRFPIFSIGW